MADYSGMKIFGGRAGKPLAEEVAQILGTKLGDAHVTPFPDGEINVELGLGEDGNVRGKHVFIINPTHMPHENIFDLLFLTDAVRLSSPERITLVIPYLGYNRKDKKDRPRTSLSSAVIIRMLVESGANGVLLLELHSDATEGMFSPLRVDRLYGSILAIPYIQTLLQEPYVVGAPDAGSARRARGYARSLGIPGGYVLFEKERDPKTGEVKKVTLIGNVEGQDVILVDDMADRGGTIISSAKSAKAHGARNVYAYVTHPVFSENALLRLDECEALDELIIANTIRHSPEALKTKRLKLTQLSIAPLIANAIDRIYNKTSMSDLFLW